MSSERLWLNWIEHLTTDQKVGGSSPSKRADTFSQRLGIPSSYRFGGIFGFDTGRRFRCVRSDHLAMSHLTPDRFTTATLEQ